MVATRIYGIDLGTTYSCISYVDASGKPVVIPNLDGDLTTPSVVYFESADNIIVGKQAKNSSKVFPDRVASFTKRYMGNPDWKLTVDGKGWKPEEISACILRKLVSDAAESIGEPITDVVITVPAYFGIAEREATKNAGKIAGLQVRHILNEPTAAATAYGVDKRANSVVLVYDLGGGTFDITVIAIENRNTQVIFTDGDHALGGKDWDDRIVNHLAECFLGENPKSTDPRSDPESLQDLVLCAEEAKKGLSKKDKWPQSVGHAGQRTRVELTRALFEELTADLLNRTLKFTEKAIAEASKKGYRIEQLLLVGGSSKMPCVQRALKERFGLEGQLFDPDQSVAKGAALQGLQILSGEVLKEEIAALQGTDVDDVDLQNVDKQLLDKAAQSASAGHGRFLRMPASELAATATRNTIDVASHSFGVIAVDEHGENEHVAHLIHAQQAVPAQHKETFFTIAANQRSVNVRVMESASSSESPDLDANRDICRGTLTDLPPDLPINSPINVTFALARDGTLDVSAVEPRSQRELKLRVQIEGVMSSDEVAAAQSLMLKRAVG